MATASAATPEYEVTARTPPGRRSRTGLLVALGVAAAAVAGSTAVLLSGLGREPAVDVAVASRAVPVSDPVPLGGTASPGPTAPSSASPSPTGRPSATTSPSARPTASPRSVSATRTRSPAAKRAVAPPTRSPSPSPTSPSPTTSAAARGAITAPAPGADVQECAVLTGTATLPAGTTLVLVVHNLDSGDGQRLAVEVSGWDAPRTTWSWQGTLSFGDDSAVGQRFAVDLLAVPLDAVRAAQGADAAQRVAAYTAQGQELTFITVARVTGVPESGCG